MSRALHSLKGAFKNVLTTLRHNKKLLTGLVSLITIFIVCLSVYPIGVPNPRLVGKFDELLTPSAKHILGTDNYGKDIFIVLLYAIQASLLIGLTAGIMGTVIGMTIGMVAGYRGGVTDHVLGGFTDMILVIPLWPILVVLVSYVQSIPLFGMGMLLGLFSWPWAARVIRSQALTLKERDYIDLAKISGLRESEIIFREILPNMIPYLSMVFVSSVQGAMLAEVGLEVIGLGPSDVNTLGLMFNSVVTNVAVLKGWWWWIVPPTLALLWIFMSLYMMTLGLDEIANPRLKKTTRL